MVQDLKETFDRDEAMRIFRGMVEESIGYEGATITPAREDYAKGYVKINSMVAVQLLIKSV